MRMHDKCLPCVINQVIKVADIAGVDTKEELLREVFTYLSKANYNADTPEIVGDIFTMIKRHTNNPDPYKETRNYYNTMFLNLIPEYERKDKEKNALWDKEPLILLIAKAVTEQNGQSGLG